MIRGPAVDVELLGGDQVPEPNDLGGIYTRCA